MGRQRKAKRITLDGEKVRQLRLARGLSQAEVAEACGFGSHTIISKIEREVQRPELETAVVIADFFGVTCEEIIKRHYPAGRFIIGESQADYITRRDLIEEILDNLGALSVVGLEQIAEQVDFQVAKRRREMLTERPVDD